jgi:hypothetical protein
VARLIIYAGFHKSGTSAIQAAFRKQAPALQAAGIYYPSGFGKHAQHILAKISAANTQEKRFRAIKRLTKRHETVLLASEFFSEQNAQDISALKSALGPGVNVEVVFSYRRIEEIVPSQYQQFIRTGYGEDLATFSKAILERDQSHHEAKLFWRRHAVSRILADWANAFGAKNVHLVNVDRLNPEYLTSWFETYLGLEPGTLDQIAESRMNRSLDLEEITFVKTLLSLLPPERIAKEWKLIFRDKMIAEIASRPSSNPSSRKISLKADHKNQFEQISNQVQSEISQLGINVHGHIMEAEKGDRASNQPLPTSIHIDTVARAIVAVRPEHHLRQASVREMAREIWYRVLRRLRGIFPKN